MKLSSLFIICVLMSIAVQAQPCITVDSECDGSTNYCGPYELSNGIYRIPFANGTSVTVTNDHFNHCPRGRIDMVGNNGNSIVAAADGWIRFIDDEHSQQCDCSETFCLNNYVWMEHPNGEWTKYTHMQYHSVPSAIDEGDYVSAGTVLGTEGEVGCASGVHLHFEVAQPVDTNTLVINTDGGYIDGNWAKNVIPVFCDITGNVLVDGEDYVAAGCGNGCAADMINVLNTFGVGDYDADIAGNSVTASGAVTVGAYASVLYQAGDYILLGAGFAALTHSTLTTRIDGCNDFPERISGETLSMNSDAVAGEHALFSLFPNPASDDVTIQFLQAEYAETSLIITNSLGMVVYEKMREGEQQEMIIPVLGLTSGLYHCRVTTGNKQSVAKLIVISR